MIGEILENRYELTDFIGKGGMALVYLAKDHRTGHAVAVKILRPEYNDNKEFLDRFDREAAAASKMTHHNIVNLLDVGISGNCRYLVMEYVKGKTLKDVIAEKGSLPEDVAAQICIRILSALQHAHNNKIIHRDIKPQNILVHSEGHIKVADFGIARLADSSTHAIQDGVMGSAHYISPEQAKGENVSFASDIYSVGVVLYEMLTGKVPFDGDSAVMIAMQHIHAQIPDPRMINPAVSQKMAAIIHKAMQKNVADRYQNAIDMAKDLQHAVYETDTPEMIEADTPVKGFFANKRRSRQSSGSAATVQRVYTKKERVRRFAITCSVAFVAFMMTVVSVLLIYNKMFNWSSVPDILGKTEQEARYECEKVNMLQFKVQGKKQSEQYPVGTVCEMIPSWGTSKKKGETVFVWISTGSETKQMIDFSGKTAEEAKRLAEGNGLVLTVSKEKQRSNKTYGLVIKQNPAAGTIVKQGENVYVTLSGGCADVPDLTGWKVENAVKYLEEAGFCGNVDIRMIPKTEGVEYGVVIEQRFENLNNEKLQIGEETVLDVNVILYTYTENNADRTERSK